MLFDSSVRKELARSFGATLIVLLTIVLTMMLIRTLGQAASGSVSPQHVVLLLGYSVLGYLPLILTLSLFVAVVSKADDPEVLLDRLCDALQAWNPPALKVLMVQARAALEKAGSTHDLGVLHSELRQAGWL